MEANSIHIVVSGGGTGGHLMPGLAVVEHLRRVGPSTRITFAGDGKPWQRELVAAIDCDYLNLPCHAMPRRIGESARFARNEIQGYLAARRFLTREKVDAVIGLGGFASVPMALAAVHRRTPLILLEQNAVPGRATRWLARWARMVCLSFSEATEHLPDRCSIAVTGNPVRRAFFAPRPAPACQSDEAACLPDGISRVSKRVPWSASDRDGSIVSLPLAARQRKNGRLSAAGVSPVPRPRLSIERPLSVLAHAAVGNTDPRRTRQLLVLGGSSGAQALNRAVPEAIGLLHRAGDWPETWRIVHQAGETRVDATARRYALTGVSARVVGRIAEMPAAMHCSDLIISRAGGTTLAELAAAELPSLLVPYPSASDDHQRANAQAMVAAGASLMVEERSSDFGPGGSDGDSFHERLAIALGGLLFDGRRRETMAWAAARLARPHAAADVAALIHNHAKTH